MNRIGWSAATLVSALAGAAGVLFPLAASAEIYGWVDPSGGVTYSNLPPPKDAKVIEVIPETPPSPAAEAAAAAAHDSEMKALNDRVRRLEWELRASRMEEPPYSGSVPPPPSGTPPGPPPGYGAPSGAYGPSPGYGANAPYPQYDVGPAYDQAACDPELFDCGLWDGPIFYTTGFAPWWGFRHHDHDFDRFHHGHHHFGGPGVGPHFGGGPMVAHAATGHGAGHAAGYGSGHGGVAGGGGTGHGH